MTIEESEYHDENKVRVVKFDDITLDLCGGTHVENSSLIENFKIISDNKQINYIIRYIVALLVFTLGVFIINTYLIRI